MSRFDDPQYMAESKAGIRSYMETGMPPRDWAVGRDRLVQGDPGNSYFRDWELRALAEALRKAGLYGNYTQHLPAHFARSPNVVSTKIAAAGGREAFLRMYGDL